MYDDIQYNKKNKHTINMVVDTEMKEVSLDMDTTCDHKEQENMEKDNGSDIIFRVKSFCLALLCIAFILFCIFGVTFIAYNITEIPEPKKVIGQIINKTDNTVYVYLQSSKSTHKVDIMKNPKNGLYPTKVFMDCIFHSCTWENIQNIEDKSYIEICKQDENYYAGEYYKKDNNKYYYNSKGDTFDLYHVHTITSSLLYYLSDMCMIYSANFVIVLILVTLFVCLSTISFIIVFFVVCYMCAFMSIALYNDRRIYERLGKCLEI